MLDSGLLSKNFIGRDGFIWWIGQVPDAKVWKGNIPTLPQSGTGTLPGFKDRVKVRILGYHTANLKNLPDEDLPWALVMLPTTSGSGSGSNAITPRFSGGEFVFGFFLDGDNGQQPVIIGILGNSSQTILSKSIPSVGFKPFSGNTSSEKSIPSYGLRESKAIENDRNVNPTPTLASIDTGSTGGQSSATISATGSDASKPANQESSRGTADIKTSHQEVQQDDNPTFQTATACKDSKKQVNGIQLALKNLVRFIQSLQKYYDSYVNPITNQIIDLPNKVEKVSQVIAGYVKDILNSVRADVLDKVNNGVKNTISKLKPTQQMRAGEEQETAIDAISCVFNKVIDGLLNLIKDFINSALGKLLSAAQCLVESMIAALMDAVIAPIQNALSIILAPLQSLLGGATSIITGIANAMNFVSSLSSFLSCEKEDKCPDNNTWSWLDGPQPESASGFANVVDSIGSFPSRGLSELAANNEFFKGTGNLGTLATGSCTPGLNNCGPPVVEVFGGGGTGALLNAIISPNGEILAVDIVSRGFDYYTNPFIYFSDACGNGTGAKAVAEVGTDGNECGKLLKIRVIDGGGGYLTSPNGSQGSEGETLVGVGSDARSLLLLDGEPLTVSSDTFGFEQFNLVGTESGISTTALAAATEPQCTEIPVTPNIPMSVLGGMTITVPPKTCIFVPKNSEEIVGLPTDFTKKENLYCFPTGATIRVPKGLEPDAPPAAGPVGATTSPTQGPTQGPTSTLRQTPTTLPSPPAYTACVTLDEVLITNTGINYNSTDEIVITPDIGAELKPLFDPYGRLIKVKVLNRGRCLQERPILTIPSETGVNAQLFPILSSETVTKEELQTRGYDPGKLVSVIDCVGKVNG
jgi:hypothetical protein